MLRKTHRQRIIHIDDNGCHQKKSFGEECSNIASIFCVCYTQFCKWISSTLINSSLVFPLAAIFHHPPFFTPGNNVTRKIKKKALLMITWLRLIWRKNNPRGEKDTRKFGLTFKNVVSQTLKFQLFHTLEIIHWLARVVCETSQSRDYCHSHQELLGIKASVIPN